MAVNKRLKRIYTSFFEVPEIKTANLISNLQSRWQLYKYRDRNYKLSNEQKASIRKIWKPYKNISYKWAAYYSAKNEYFSPYYIPNDLYYSVIDQHFNSRRLGYGFNDKNYYSKIFEDIPQPKTLVRKINALLFDANYNQISEEEGYAIMQQEAEIICKPSQESGSGRGIEFVKSSDEFCIRRILTDKAYDDYIVQALIEQHPALSQIHPTSINSIRITSLLMPEGVKILSAILRMGAGDSRVDNASSSNDNSFGNISVGIAEDGKLKKYGHNCFNGDCTECHPGGIRFYGYVVPSFMDAVELVKKAHPRIGHFRLVAWDIAIDKTGTPILIEANMRKGGLETQQFNNGPLFENVMFEMGGGKNLTMSVLNEVFHK